MLVAFRNQARHEPGGLVPANADEQAAAGLGIAGEIEPTRVEFAVDFDLAQTQCVGGMRGGSKARLKGVQRPGHRGEIRQS